MTAVERAARKVIAAAWRWNVARGQDLRTWHLAEDFLREAVEAHGDAVKRSLNRRVARARRAKKK